MDSMLRCAADRITRISRRCSLARAARGLAWSLDAAQHTLQEIRFENPGRKGLFQLPVLSLQSPFPAAFGLGRLLQAQFLRPPHVQQPLGDAQLSRYFPMAAHGHLPHRSPLLSLSPTTIRSLHPKPPFAVNGA